MANPASNNGGQQHGPPLRPEEFAFYRALIFGSIQLCKEESAENLLLVPLSPLITETRRANAKHPPLVTIQVPEEAIKNLRGDPDQQDLYFIGAVPRQIAERIRVPTPGETPIVDAKGRVVGGGRGIYDDKEKGGAN